MICAFDIFRRAPGSHEGLAVLDLCGLMAPASGGCVYFENADARGKGVPIEDSKVLSFTTSVPAKINLWLEVVGKRTDGYHELSSLMLPIGIYDQVGIELHARDRISMECDVDGVPPDARNLAWRAAERYFEATGLRAGLHIRLSKSIPVGAGLGGGSADAAAVLLTLNQLFDGRLSGIRMAEIARALGADVPFFLYRRPALATGIGEKLEWVEGLPRYPLVLIKPPLTVSTAWVYRSLKLTRAGSDIKLGGILTNPWRLEGVIRNDLEAVTLAEYPFVARIKKWLLEQGAVAALMSGSGPTVFGVFRDQRQAEGVESRAKLEWKQCWVARTEVLGASSVG
jgi:4-diphosphocytidyl-2-C-methyl-D-erythritol kinase